MIRKYVKRIEPVEAVHWLGNNVTTVIMFGAGRIKVNPDHTLIIQNPEGSLIGHVGDYIIKKDEFIFPWPHDLFKETYIEVRE